MAVKLSDRIHVGYEVVAAREWAHELDLKILARLKHAHAVLLAETLDQMNALFQHPIPVVALGITQRLLLIYAAVQDNCSGPIEEKAAVFCHKGDEVRSGVFRMCGRLRL